MQTMDTQFAQNAQNAADERLFVKFYMGVLKNEEKSAEAGHPVFDDIPFIRIIVPGDKNTVIDTIADDNYKARFSRLWHQFQSNQQQTSSGMPIDQWPAITRSQAEELKYLNVTTVEQLAEMADSFGAKLMNFNDLKRKATVFLQQAKDSAFATKLSEVNKAQTDRIVALEAEIARLSAMFEASQHMKAVNDNRSGTVQGRRG